MIRIDFDKLDKIFPSAYFEFVSGCCEPRYDDKPIILADWNYVKNEVYDKLESHGYLCEWSDEWIICDSCYKAFRSSPDSYQWQMAGIILDGYALCLNCLNPLEYFESIENNNQKALTWPIIDKYDPEKYGYKLLHEGYENGLHPGQNDDPKTILAELLKNNPNGCFLFAMTNQGQFDIEFSVYEKVNDNDEK